MAEQLEYGILGPLEVRRGETVVPVRRSRLRSVLACLLLAHGDAVSVPRLVESVWGPGAPPSADGLVRVYVSQIRAALGDDSIITRTLGYSVADLDDRLDAERFQRLLTEASRQRTVGGDEEAEATLADALALWRGPALVDTPVAGDAAVAIAELEEQRLHAVELHAELVLQGGRHAEIVGTLERETTAHPTRELLREQLMLALYRSGRQSEALAVYADLRRYLVDELGLEPSPRIQELQSRILRHDPDLGVPTTHHLTGSRAHDDRGRGTLRRVAVVMTVGAVCVFLVAGWVATRPSPAPKVGPESVVRVDAGRLKVRSTVRLKSAPGALLATGSAVWVVEPNGRELVELDPKRLTVRRRVALAAVPHALVESSNELWLANGFSGTLSRVGADGRVGYPIRPEARATGRLALAAGNDAIWIGSQDGRLTRFAPSSQRAVSITLGIHSPEALTLADGSVWVAQATSVAIQRVDMATGRVTAQIPVGDVPNAIASAAGYVWALVPAQGRLWKIDPRNNSVAGSIPVPGASFLAVCRGTVWVGEASTGIVRRVVPLARETIDLSHPITALAGGPSGIIAATD